MSLIDRVCVFCLFYVCIIPYSIDSVTVALLTKCLAENLLGVFNMTKSINFVCHSVKENTSGGLLMSTELANFIKANQCLAWFKHPSLNQIISGNKPVSLGILFNYGRNV